MTDQKEFNKRYKQAYDLFKKLLKNKLKIIGKIEFYNSEKTLQSVLGSFEVTKLIMNCDFKSAIYNSKYQV